MKDICKGKYLEDVRCLFVHAFFGICTITDTVNYDTYNFIFAVNGDNAAPKADVTMLGDIKVDADDTFVGGSNFCIDKEGDTVNYEYYVQDPLTKLFDVKLSTGSSPLKINGDGLLYFQNSLDSYVGSY